MRSLTCTTYHTLKLANYFALQMTTALHTPVSLEQLCKGVANWALDMDAVHVATAAHTCVRVHCVGSWVQYLCDGSGRT